MAHPVVEYTRIEDEDFCSYSFELDGNKYLFNAVSFNGINEYNSFIEEGGLRIFDILTPDQIKSSKKIVGYSWDIDKTNNHRVNMFQLAEMIELIGKDYAVRHWPDIVFYESKDHRFHEIYCRMFSSCGYHLGYSINHHHVYFRE